MRIVQLANFYGPTSGGLRTAIDELAERYCLQGHACLTIVPGPENRLTVQGRRHLRRIQAPRLPGSGGYRVITRLTRALRAIEEFEPDVVELSDQTTLAWLAPALRHRRVPIVLFAHERLDERLRTRWAPSFVPGVRRYAALVAGTASAIIVCSRFASDAYAELGPVVRVVPLGVDLATFTPAARRRAISPTAASRRLICVSRLHREKRLELAIDAVRALHDSGMPVTLDVVGDGPRRAALTRRARGLPVRFTGHIAGRASVAALLADADLAIACGPVETFGLAALEALACGTPVATTRHGAVQELVGRAGVVTDADPQQLAAGIAELLERDPRDVRAAARRQAEAYTWERSATQTLAVLRAVASPAGFAAQPLAEASPLRSR